MNAHRTAVTRCPDHLHWQWYCKPHAGGRCSTWRDAFNAAYLHALHATGTPA